MSSGPTTAITTGEKVASYIPIGGKVAVELTIKTVRNFLCTPTKKGVYPNDADVIKFIKLCQARELDPWTGDAWLIGYDDYKGGPPTFSLITGIQALLKRAEMNPDYDGMEAGVVIERDSKVDMRPGDLLLDGEKLLGGWARVLRKSQSVPSFDSIKLSTFDTGYSRWKIDPAGMIVKCAQASALRTAFPTQLGGLYTADEMRAMSDDRTASRGSTPSLARVTSLDALSERLGDTAAPQITKQTEESTPPGTTEPSQEPIPNPRARTKPKQQQEAPLYGHTNDAPLIEHDAQEPPVDAKSAIAERFAQAVTQGLDAVEVLYDLLAGPNSTVPSELMEWIGQCYEIAKRRVAEAAKTSGKTGKSTQKQAFD